MNNREEFILKKPTLQFCFTSKSQIPYRDKSKNIKKYIKPIFKRKKYKYKKYNPLHKKPNRERNRKPKSYRTIPL
ncbi:hypothetical protein MBAV_003669 [Candidatus Magnetobacterium bavaricum]|uniref:Uncharacterized protein n=1 Tax=Candidatus Magnetobacterium bavaricum TaxID=29290 RepID=A0A0F3GQC7_9BACT|nr:hypothetical protein MBAV_003669 [Candidatus Magnetobacterium bavaricum]